MNMLRYSFLIILSVTLAPVVWASEAYDWLQDMRSAIQTKTYSGTLVHVQGKQVQSVRLLHRNKDGVVSERLQSLDGEPREIVRHQGKRHCYFPKQKVVLEEGQIDLLGLDNFYRLSQLLEQDTDTAKAYEATVVREKRVDGRKQVEIAIRPKDDYRYGYLLWLDKKTAMPIRSMLHDERGRSIEKSSFTDLVIHKNLPDSAFVAKLDTQDYKVYKLADNQSLPTATTMQVETQSIPAGFELSPQANAGTKNTNHMIYSDGLVNVSVFVEPDSDTDTIQASTFVPFNSYSHKINGKRITAVGGVPPKTVKQIALAVRVN